MLKDAGIIDVFPDGMTSGKVATETAEVIIQRRYLARWRGFLYRLALSRIEWRNLPKEIPDFAIEEKLIREGSAIFFNAGDEDNPVYVVTSVGGGDVVDIYNQPLTYRATTALWERDVAAEDCAIIFDSLSRIPILRTLNDYAYDLSELDHSASTNVRQQRWGIIVSGPEGALADAAKIKREIEEGKPVTVRIKAMDDVGGVTVSSMSAGAPYVADKLYSTKQELLGEVYSYLGIMNVGRDKQQYMNLGEVSLNDDAVNRIREDLLAPRREACERINELFGLEVEVDWRTSNAAVNAAEYATMEASDNDVNDEGGDDEDDR